MKSQPNRDYVSNDDIETPEWLAHALVSYFRPSGKILEPCRASGRIWSRLPPGSDWCEIKQGRDFLTMELGAYDWIITNPPWSQIRLFLARSLSLADNVVFLMTINHAWTTARLREVRSRGFGIKTIVLIPMPKDFPQGGFQLGAVHYQKGWAGPITVGEITAPEGQVRARKPRR